MITTRILLSLGSNLEPRAERIGTALEYLKQYALRDVVVSHIYTTEPVGYRNQPDFLNIAVTGQTSLSAPDLFTTCKVIEHTMGRQHRQQWREREIDIDIILYGDAIVDSNELTLPHPRMYERRFVLVPAQEVAGDMVDPITHKTITDLLAACSDESRVTSVE